MTASDTAERCGWSWGTLSGESQGQPHVHRRLPTSPGCAGTFAASRLIKDHGHAEGSRIRLCGLIQGHAVFQEVRPGSDHELISHCATPGVEV